jgi:hypothetical protein
MSATTLVDARTSAIRASLRQARRGEDFWESAVVAPSKELVKALEVLNDNFARGLLYQVGYSGLPIAYCICTLLSKWFASMSGDMELLVGGFVWFIIIAGGIPAVQCTMLLGAVSTSCDDFMDDLNTLRGENFDDDTHARIFKLETFLRNVNHGQGIGFKVGGLVLTKKFLFIMFVEFLTGLLFIVPIMLSHGVAEEDSTNDSVSIGDDACGLTPSEIAVIQSGMLMRNESCTYNLTLDEILGM